jgi:sorting nexin-9/18/33
MPPVGPSFYARVFHPAFNLDAEDAAEAVNRFETHTRAVGKSVQGLRNIFGQVREARVGESPRFPCLPCGFRALLMSDQEMSKAERLLSYSLLSLITAKPLASATMTGIGESDDSSTSGSKGAVNSDGAWCWRDGCHGWPIHSAIL